MKQFMVISILATLSCITFAQGNDANAPGKKGKNSLSNNLLLDEKKIQVNQPNLMHLDNKTRVKSF